jgi:hypothetical protein
MSNLPQSKIKTWAGIILQVLVSLMFLLGAFMNITRNPQAVKGAVEMGYKEESLIFLGLTLLLAVILYNWRRTAFIGAILLTGWLGGAVATHMIKGDAPGFVLMPVFFGMIVWLALWLRGRRFV